MLRFSLSWSIKVDGDRQRGRQENPQWSEMEAVLERIIGQSGWVILDADRQDDDHDSLELRADRSHYLLTLGEVRDDDYNVRSFTNATTERGPIDILGDSWDG